MKDENDIFNTNSMDIPRKMTSQGIDVLKDSEFIGNLKTNNDQKCQLHLSEFYSLSKKCENLGNLLTQKSYESEKLTKEINEFIESQKLLNHVSSDTINKLSIVNNRLEENIKLLTAENPYSKIFDYYESQILELDNKYKSNYNNLLNSIYTSNINSDVKDENKKINSNSSSFLLKSPKSREIAFKNIIRNLDAENKSLKVELQMFHKKARSLNSKQEFFNKYVYEAEKRFEELSKKNLLINKLEEDIKKYKTEISFLSKENENHINVIKYLHLSNTELKSKNENFNFNSEYVRSDNADLSNKEFLKYGLNKDMIRKNFNKLLSSNDDMTNYNSKKDNNNKFNFTESNLSCINHKTKDSMKSISNSKIFNEEKKVDNINQDYDVKKNFGFPNNHKKISVLMKNTNLGSKSNSNSKSKSKSKSKCNLSKQDRYDFSFLIEKINDKQFEKIKSINTEYSDYLNKNNELDIINDTNIMKILLSLKELVATLITSEVKINSNIDKQVIESIFSNLKSYFIYMLSCIKKLSSNQCHLIEICCKFKDKLSDAIKRYLINKDSNPNSNDSINNMLTSFSSNQYDHNSFNLPKSLFNAYYNDLINVCNVMISENNPKKFDFLLKKN